MTTVSRNVTSRVSRTRWWAERRRRRSSGCSLPRGGWVNHTAGLHPHGGFETGRSIDATNKVTGALHASILERFGVDASSYGNPMGSPIAGI